MVAVRIKVVFQLLPMQGGRLLQEISSALHLVLSVAARNLNRRGEHAGAEGQVLAVLGAMKVLKRTTSEALIEELCSLGVDDPVEAFQDGELTPRRRAAVAVLQFLERQEVRKAFGLTCKISPGLLQVQGA